MNKLLKSKKGNSLLEVLIALGIISVTLVGSVRVIVTNLAGLKSNEIEDSANEIMIQGMEIAKSPDKVLVSDASINTAVLDKVISFNLYNANGVNTLNLGNDAEISDCDKNSLYFIKPTEGSNDTICLQINITPRIAPGNIRYYEIISTVVYKIPGDTVINAIKGYRYNDFKTQ